MPVGPSQAETEDPVLIEWRETSAPWADEELADRVVRYGTWLSPGPSRGRRYDTGPRWVGMPLRVVRGQDRGTVDRRNNLAYDGLLVIDRD